MFFKRFGVFVLGLICGVSLKAHAYIAPLSPQSFEQLYAYAAAGKVDILTNAVSRGMNIDSINSNGDTGLCVAARRGNRRAYKSFLTAGANPSHECTWDIKGYREFMQSVISNPVKNLDTAAVAKYGATGMSWTTKALIGAGVVAAGGGAALAFSGGGGGSSSDPNCIHGYRNKDDACICHTGYDGPKCNDCATGYGHYGTSNCYPDIPDCGHGTQVGGGCKCDTGYAGPSCHACASGYGFDSTGVCVIQSADMLGNSVNRNYNKIGAIYLDSTTYQNVYGLFYDAEDTYGDRAPHLPQSTFVNAHEYLRDVDATSTIGSADMPVHNIGTNTESITINKNGSGHVYGMYSSTAENIYHNYLYLQSGIVIGTLNATTSITSKGDGNVYGMYGNGDLYGAYFDGIAGQYISDDDPPVTLYSNLHMNSTILASNIGSGAVYGMYNGSSTGTIYNMNSTQTYTDTDDIVHTLSQTTSSVMAANLDSGDAYGLYSKGEIYHSGTLTTTANTGNAYGMSAATSITALTSANVTSIDGKAVGMYGLGDGVFINANYLTVSSTNSDVYGAHLQKGGSFANGGQIKVTTTTGNAIGVYAHDVGMTNSWGTSNGALIVSTTTGDAYGVHMTGNSALNNTASILVSTANGNAYGIYNVGGSVTNTATFPDMSVYVNNTGSTGIACGIYSDGGTVQNEGRIDVYGAPGTTTYGIWATNHAVVTLTNTFVISINNSTLDSSNCSTLCNASGCTTPLGGQAVYLTNGATLINAGALMSMSALSLGKSGVTLAPTGSISAMGPLSGGLSISSAAVTSGFNDTYTLKGAINAEDTSNLHLTSESALFDAALNGQDVVLTKKSFAEVTQNASFADFLEKNYALHHNEALFEALKSQTNLRSLTDSLKDLTGDKLKSFALEDMMLLKELDFDINKAFKDNAQNSFTLTGDNTARLGKKTPSNERYRWLVSGKKDGQTTFGVGVAFTSLKNNRNTKRHDEMFLTMMPLGYRTHGLDFLSTLRLGYAYGTYTRHGFNSKEYTGTVEKRILGLTNAVSYPFKINAWTLAPTAEFNLLGYRLKGAEDAQRFALKIQKQNITSMEAGIGFGLNYAADFAPHKKLNFATQLMLYHEFLDPYRLKLGMQDMTGSFELKDEKRRAEHLALKNTFEYRFDALSVYADLFSYIDREYTTKADIGFKWAF